MKKLLLVIFALSLNAVQAAMQNEIFRSSISSVQCHLAGNALSFPAMNLGSTAGIEISFDNLGSTVHDLQYRILYCNANWEVTSLLPIEYIDGFQEGRIEPASANLTVQDYIHYEFTLPNSATQLRLSGNYIVQIQNTETGELWMQRRIMVNEEAIKFSAIAKRATIIEYCDEFQEVDCAVSTEGLNVFDPFSDIKLVILQNSDWRTACTGLRPRFVNQYMLDYDYEEGNLFPAGNEFRRFMMRNYGHSVPEIAHLRLKPERNEIDLTPVRDRQFLQYDDDDKDLDGRYYIIREDADNSDVDADYALVKFTLQHDVVLDGHVCIYGQLTDWKCDTLAPLEYDYDKNQYSGTLMLKQGYYDYRYAIQRSGQSAVDQTYFEGTHYRTENEYQVLVYFCDRIGGHDRLVGFRTIQYRDK